jgi:hypothetical protein
LHAVVAPRPDGALEIEDRIVARCQRVNAELSQLLRDVAEFDRREAWRADGAHSMAHWLQMMTSVSERTAKEWVVAANALKSLPRIASAFDEASLSWDQVRPLASFATSEDDERLAREGPCWSPAALEDEARRRKRITCAEAAKTQADRFLKRRWDRESGVLRVWGQLPYEQGALVEKTLDSMAKQGRIAGQSEPLGALRADALTELCSSWSFGRRDSDSSTVVIHVDAKELAAVRGTGELENGVALSADTVRRASCDGAIQMVVWSEDGAPLGVGRKTRVVPHWLMRLVKHRDKGCRFPDCGRVTWTDVHHIDPWCRGGRTDLNNLCELCGYHHTLVHEGGWRISGNPSGELGFTPPGVSPIAGRGRQATRGP